MWNVHLKARCMQLASVFMHESALWSLRVHHVHRCVIDLMIFLRFKTHQIMAVDKKFENKPVWRLWMSHSKCFFFQSSAWLGKPWLDKATNNSQLLHFENHYDIRHFWAKQPPSRLQCKDRGSATGSRVKQCLQAQKPVWQGGSKWVTVTKFVFTRTLGIVGTGSSDGAHCWNQLNQDISKVANSKSLIWAVSTEFQGSLVRIFMKASEEWIFYCKSTTTNYDH